MKKLFKARMSKAQWQNAFSKYSIKDLTKLESDGEAKLNQSDKGNQEMEFSMRRSNILLEDTGMSKLNYS